MEKSRGWVPGFELSWYRFPGSALAKFKIQPFGLCKTARALGRREKIDSKRSCANLYAKKYAQHCGGPVSVCGLIEVTENFITFSSWKMKIEKYSLIFARGLGIIYERHFYFVNKWNWFLVEIFHLLDWNIEFNCIKY